VRYREHNAKGKFVPVLNSAPSQGGAWRSGGITARISNLRKFTLGDNIIIMADHSGRAV
jgi:hypothetical protein